MVVLQTLWGQQLFSKFSKCEFCLKSVAFLGYMVFKDKIIVDPTNIEAVYDWVSTLSPIEVCSFIGLPDYYTRFIKGFSSFAVSLTRLTWIDVPFHQSNYFEASFLKLKALQTSIPITTLSIQVQGFQYIMMCMLLIWIVYWCNMIDLYHMHPVSGRFLRKTHLKSHINGQTSNTLRVQENQLITYGYRAYNYDNHGT